MKTIETKRIIIRAFTSEDWPDLHELAIDWAKAPGPSFDKWPTSQEEVKSLTDYFTKNDRYFAVTLRESKKVIGLIALNEIDPDRQLDLGHVILSKYQDNDLDREALDAMVEHVFKNEDVLSIVTRNAPDHIEQLAPLKDLGFKVVNQEQKGELVLTKAEWEN